MWRNPGLVFQAQPNFFKFFEEYEFYKVPLPVEAVAPEHSTARHILEGFYTALGRKFQSVQGLPRVDAQNEFLKFFYDETLKIVRLIEGSGRYLLVSDFWSVAVSIGLQHDYTILSRQYQLKEAVLPLNMSLHMFLLMIAKMIHILVGDETKVLIGTKDNSPVWQSLPVTVTTHEEASKIDIPCDTQMAMIGAEEAEFVGPYGKTANFSSEEVDPRLQAPGYRQVLVLLEAAFANMRFFPSPEGQYIKFKKPGLPVVSMLFKVLPASSDETSFGFVARIEYASGFHTLCIDDIMTLLRTAPEYEQYKFDQVFFSFSLWLCIQVYHDLVTAKEIAVDRSSIRINGKDKKKKVKPTPVHPETGWVYIPRVISGEPRSVRKPILDSREPYTPRYVRMHRRRVRMSEEHRTRIEEFEAQYGLQILRFVPEGYTVVRPYISPEISRHEWGRLPRYIKARIQYDLEQLISEMNNPKIDLINGNESDDSEDRS